MRARAATYEPKEELLNVISHGAGLLMAITGLVLIVVNSSLYKTVWHIVSNSIYGSSLVLLYLASTVYHASKHPVFRIKANIIDHAMIYVLIAGTYTPFTLITLQGPWGWSIFGVIWGLAIAGIIFKVFMAGRWDKVSTVAYVLMGWIAVIAIYPLVKNMAGWGLFWLGFGGLFYTLGAIFYLKKSLRFNHFIFHIFVLLGSISHYICIYFYV
ncbi:MAG TPA: hemolysin D [Saprospirales bacterium]|nr:hemolysin D [Saprospirales bacterium]HAY70379.1 hemolysin D [Saprospirales bacterium]HRQ28668.1 hemolysin III family protein [Saprospiraceae bacterium]